jgi:hypothetical protein
MDDTAFDDVARLAASTRSRRWFALKLAGGIAAGIAGFTMLEPETTEARKRRRRRKKRKGQDRCELTVCDGQCVDLKSDQNNCGACGEACAEGLTCCDGVCRALESDNSNCGACGTECFLSGSRFCACGVCVFCPLGATIAAGSCSCDCPDGQTNCNGVCRDTC